MNEAAAGGAGTSPQATAPSPSPLLKGSPLDRIRALQDQMSGVTLKLANWFLRRDPMDAGFTTGQIAAELGTSRATVVRFCQRLGYAGFPEFKAAWLEGAVAARERSGAPIPETFPAAARRIFAVTRESIDAAVHMIDPQAFEQTVQAMCRASLTVWCGLPGDAALIAQSGDHKMTRAALRSRWVSDAEGLQSVVRMAAPGDLLMVISHSGRWPWVAEQMEAFRGRGGRVSIVTNRVDSIMARAADWVLLSPERELSLSEKPMALRAVQWMVVEMLVVEAVTRKCAGALTWDVPL